MPRGEWREGVDQRWETFSFVEKSAAEKNKLTLQFCRSGAVKDALGNGISAILERNCRNPREQILQ
ncbi:MAG: hypothetical protein WCF90_10260 [Methanomicrobiales archaeon]